MWGVQGGRAIARGRCTRLGSRAVCQRVDALPGELASASLMWLYSVEGATRAVSLERGNTTVGAQRVRQDRAVSKSHRIDRRTCKRRAAQKNTPDNYSAMTLVTEHYQKEQTKVPRNEKQAHQTAAATATQQHLATATQQQQRSSRKETTTTQNRNRSETPEDHGKKEEKGREEERERR